MNAGFKSLIAGGVVLLLIVFVCVFMLVAVPTQHRGVLTFGGEITGLLTEGYHIVNPLKKSNPISLQMQVETVQCFTFSQENQDVITHVNLVYVVKPVDQCIINVYRNLSAEPKRWSDFITPTLQDTIKTITIQYPIKDVVSKREAIRIETLDTLRKLIADKFDNFEILRLEIVNMDYSKAYKEEIEARNKMAQEALRAKEQLDKERNLAQITVIQTEALINAAENEAKATIIRAKAQAEAFEKMKEAISWQLVMWEAIRKWNGNLPFGNMRGEE